MNEQVNQLVMNADLTTMPGGALTPRRSSCSASNVWPPRCVFLANSVLTRALG